MSDLTLKLSDNTLKKLRALAMLSGATVGELEQEFASYFDQMLSENITARLSELDGRVYESSVTPSAPKVREVATEVSQSDADPNTHDLSEDDLPSEVKSVEEEAEEIQLPTLYNIPEAGDNAEAFLDGAFAEAPRLPVRQQQQQPTASYMGTPVRSAKKSFHPSVVKAKVSEYTGDETQDLF